ncbi:HAMP domain-containing sensor histidine kinase [Hydrotalea sandarakina]|jgi:PAS domain S-box-containing protein|uniref:histidine kinase n=1 Tax=Hydrotalea sandarakina TaxID=1004304 RepID=A0A2W7RY64_9BACT|nr:ATP-binding protein [Hydrotalea sandarakina]PZX65718.1 PAS domain S-box-containing protein [Hydrotalea sandarakina]
MKTKSKLSIGIGLLFVMIVLLTTLSIFYINKLSNDSKNILVANYNTIDYCRKMEIALNDGIEIPNNKQLFLNSLQLQQKNITELGEKELTDELWNHFQELVVKPQDTIVIKEVRNDISAIMLLNMQAIERKSNIANITAQKSVFWITISGTICFLAAFIMFVNLPGSIANPIQELTNSIKQIAAQNYSQRVHFSGHDEFAELAASFNSMAEKLEAYQLSNLEKLMMEKKRIETLIDNLQDPIIGLDEQKKILFMNTIALQITGLKSDEVKGKFIQDIAVKNDLIRNLIQELFSDTGTTSLKKQPIKIYAEGKESYFEKEIIPIRIIPTGETVEKLIGNVILLQNITPYKELDFAKTNFIATISHELKTPLSSIQLSTALLSNKQIGNLNTEQQELIDSIKEDAGRLLKITGELLNLSQLESGLIQLSVVECNPLDLVHYALEANQKIAEQKKVSIRMQIPDELPNVKADKDRTSWVLSNLLSNAIRYSYENSSVIITILNKGNALHFAVQDFGVGIPPQYLNKIFDRYFRIPGNKSEGTGLGLSICKEFMNAQGSDIKVVSDFGSGSTFSFDLPVV